MTGRRLHVSTDLGPEPSLLRPAIAAVLAGHAWPAGPERAVADAVRDAVEAARGGPSTFPAPPPANPAGVSMSPAPLAGPAPSGAAPSGAPQPRTTAAPRPGRPGRRS